MSGLSQYTTKEELIDDLPAETELHSWHQLPNDAFIGKHLLSAQALKRVYCNLLTGTQRETPNT